MIQKKRLSSIKEEFSNLEDLAFNKLAVKRDKKKKAFKKYKQNFPNKDNNEKLF